MRLPAILLSVLLGACDAGQNNAATNEEVSPNANAVGGTAAPPSNAAGPSAPAGTEGSGTAQNGSADVTAPEPSGRVTLSAAPARVAAGDTITLTLTNGTRGQVGFNLCTSGLQTSTGHAVPGDRVCTMELGLLPPGRSASYRYELPARLANGSYRLRTSVDRDGAGAGLVVTSNSFEVR